MPRRQNTKDPESITGRMNHVAFIASLDRIDLDDPEAVHQRFNEYFDNCYKNGMIPSVPEFALALGVSQQILTQWRIGSVQKDKRIIEDIDRAYQIINATQEGLLLDGQLETVPAIFLDKNHHGYRDTTEAVVRHANLLGETTSPEDLKAKYLKTTTQKAIEASEVEENG